MFKLNVNYDRALTTSQIIVLIYLYADYEVLLSLTWYYKKLVRCLIEFIINKISFLISLI